MAAVLKDGRGRPVFLKGSGSRLSVRFRVVWRHLLGIVSVANDVDRGRPNRLREYRLNHRCARPAAANAHDAFQQRMFLRSRPQQFSTWSIAMTELCLCSSIGTVDRCLFKCIGTQKRRFTRVDQCMQAGHHDLGSAYDAQDTLHWHRC